MEPIYYQQQIPDSLRVIYVREGVYERLQQVLTLLPQEYCLLLYDGYRPFQVQQHLFSHFSQQLAKGCHNQHHKRLCRQPKICSISK